MGLSTLWFIKDDPDFEREQWSLKAYLRDAKTDIDNRKLEPFYTDIKRRITDLESFLMTRKLVSDLTVDEKRRLAYFNDQPDVSDHNREVYNIVRWGIKELQSIRKEYNRVWREVESSFSLFYIGDKPEFKVDKGVLLVRYAGSHITEVYSFEDNDGVATFSQMEYTDEEYHDIKKRLGDDDLVFVVAESSTAFNTEVTVMPFLARTFEKKVLS